MFETGSLSGAEVPVFQYQIISNNKNDISASLDACISAPLDACISASLDARISASLNVQNRDTERSRSARVAYEKQ